MLLGMVSEGKQTEFGRGDNYLPWQILVFELELVLPSGCLHCPTLVFNNY